MKHKVVLLCVFFGKVACCQQVFEFATKEAREKHDLFLRDSIIKKELSLPLSGLSEPGWKKAFWAMELMLYRKENTKEKLKYAWAKAPLLSENFQRSLLEVSYTLYPQAFDSYVLDLLKKTTSRAIVCRCAEYLLLSANASTYKKVIRNKINQFPGNDPDCISILKRRIVSQGDHSFPDLTPIFKPTFLPGEVVIYSFQRKNRDYPGMVIIRKSDGEFLRDNDGNLFSTTQLARSITNYPFYITNGNTPQGIFRWNGFDTSTIAYIGPTPNLQLFMPGEVSPSVFFDDSSYSGQQWSKELYCRLLPSALKNVASLYESFWAGMIGRTEIIMHGTGINSDYYKNQPYFPQTPSLGCLCSYEQWDVEGKRIVSNQQKIVDALTSIGANKGYVVVVDLNNEKQPVDLSDLCWFRTNSTHNDKK